MIKRTTPVIALVVLITTATTNAATATTTTASASTYTAAATTTSAVATTPVSGETLVLRTEETAGDIATAVLSLTEVVDPERADAERAKAAKLEAEQAKARAQREKDRVRKIRAKKIAAERRARALAASVPPVPRVDMVAYTVVDLDTGEILAAKNAHRHLRPASTQKMLTAVTLLPRLDIKARYIATQKDLKYEGTAIGLRPGYAYTIDQLFYGMLVPSANDAANALARANGGIAKTLAMMNAKAREIGAKNTVAATPSGLDPDHGEVQHTTAYDLAVIAREGMRNPHFRRYVQARRYAFPSGNGGTVALHTTNRLWGKCRGVIGIKTGYTSKALNTYVGAASRNGHRIMVTGLKMYSPSAKIARLINWGFAARGKVRPVGHLPTIARHATARPRAFSLSLRPAPHRVLF